MKTLAMAPTWAAVLPIYLDALKYRRRPVSVDAATKEITHMATLADERNALVARVAALEATLARIANRTILAAPDTAGHQMVQMRWALAEEARTVLAA